MTNSRRSFLAACLMGLSVCPQLGWAADAFPTKPVTLVVPFPPGGVVDVIARRVGEKMSAALSTPVIIENKPGAGGTLGAAYVARAQPDGYTVLVGGAATQVFGPLLYKDVQYDALRSFAPVGQISSGPLVLVVNPSVPSRTFPELVAYLRENGPRLFYGNNGNGTFPHLAGELFKQAYGLSYTQVPYSGGAGAIRALVANEVQLSINHIPLVQGMIKAGRIRALATTGKTRSLVFPDLPTFDEAGVKGFEANAWFGLFAPAKTPAAVVDKLNQALASALKDSSVKAALQAQGDEVSYSTPQALTSYVESEAAKWGGVVKAAGLKLE